MVYLLGIISALRDAGEGTTLHGIAGLAVRLSAIACDPLVGADGDEVGEDITTFKKSPPDNRRRAAYSMRGVVGVS